MLLAHKELCVCQLMGILGVSSPDFKKPLLLSSAGSLMSGGGKLVFYSVKKTTAPMARKILELLRTELKDTARLREDLRSLTDCHEFQIKTGRCDMKTFLSFMEKQRTKK